MRKHIRRAAAGITAIALLGAVACGSQKSAEERKVEELQAQLDEAKKQLAEKEAQSAAAAEPAKVEPQPPPAPASPAPSQATRATGKAAPAAKPSAAGTDAKASEQYARDKAKVKEAYAQQQTVNEQQSRTNEQVQHQIEELKPREYTLPVGTVIPVRTTAELSSSKLSNGAVFDALLERALVVDGTVLAPEGAPVTGVVVSSDKGGRVKGVASLAVTIRAIAGVRDQTIRVRATSYGAEAATSKGKDAARTGILAGAGAVVGAIAGGGKGAAIGAGAGAATGVGVNAATRGKAAVIPAETLMEFSLTAPATVVLRP